MKKVKHTSVFYTKYNERNNRLTSVFFKEITWCDNEQCLKSKVQYHFLKEKIF